MTKGALFFLSRCDLDFCCGPASAGASEQERLVSSGPDGNNSEFGAGQLGDGLQVGAGARRQLLPAGGLARGLSPAGEIDVNRLAACQQVDIVGDVIVGFLADAV